MRTPRHRHRDATPPPGQGIGDKPVDVGNGRVAASVGRTNAALLSLLVPHPDHGAVELTAAPRFDERRRGDPAETRRHRTRLTEDRFACLWLEGADGGSFRADEIDLDDPLRPEWHGTLDAGRVRASATAEPGGIVLTWQATTGLMPPPRLRFEGRLEPPALAEITETDPHSPGRFSTALRADGRRLEVSAPELAAKVVLEADAGAWTADGAGAWLDLSPDPGRQGLIAVVRCRGDLAVRQPRLPEAASGLEAAIPPAMRPIVARALAYVRGCTALATSPDERVILTDHRLLPLSWTRDAYFQALLLVARDGQDDRRRVADHLRWLWRRCERPDGRWARSHYADGRRKDLAFQADQQLYPMLELADFWRRTGAIPDGVDWTDEVAGAWSATMHAVDPVTGLLVSTETAADDPVPAPLLASSQIVLWYAAHRLAEMSRAGALEIDEEALVRVAEGARKAFHRTFIRDGRWAYAGDGANRLVAYHDANDLPTALAPFWGFCPADDPTWRATMDWAFSPANPGYYPGEFGGLGSIHTPGPWTLGDVQRWLAARAVADEAGARRALERLRAVSFADGMLPEAYDVGRPDDGRIRHWFAWPGAALSALLILDGRREFARLLHA